jgi:hypothetical protein
VWVILKRSSEESATSIVLSDLGLASASRWPAPPGVRLHGTVFYIQKSTKNTILNAITILTPTKLLLQSYYHKPPAPAPTLGALGSG